MGDILRREHPVREQAAGVVTMLLHPMKATKQQKILANQAVTLAIRKGELIRQACEKCGATCGSGTFLYYPVTAHHEDYGRPLDVTWLCWPCHKTRHREIRTEYADPSPIGAAS